MLKESFGSAWAKARRKVVVDDFLAGDERESRVDRRVMQQKTQRPVQFEITEQTRSSMITTGQPCNPWSG
ncbi:hypothetical protein M1M10_31775, partial [Pseudomonas umsongensis]|nr:hypothetical protein [Pseudomonas umsongensis]